MTCPICHARPTIDDATICQPCLASYQRDLARLADIMPSLYAVATKQARIAPATHGPRHNDALPLPVNERAFTLWRQSTVLAAYTISVVYGRKPRRADIGLLLRKIACTDLNGFAGNAQLVTITRTLVTDAENMLCPPEETVYAGNCPHCNARIYAPKTQAGWECACGTYLNLDSVRADILRREANTDVSLTPAELVRWLSDRGVRISRPTLWRWTKHHEISVSEPDEQGRRTYNLGSILRRLRRS